MDTEANFEDQAMEQLIDGMMSFLDDKDEDGQLKEFDELKNPFCWAIKRIINIYPVPPRMNGFHSFELENNIREPHGTFCGNWPHANQIEKVCRDKDPYMLEVNRLMFCSSVGHPPNGSPEYYQAAENYALFGKEFLDFPTDLKFPQPLDVGCCALQKLQPSQVFGMQIGKCTKQLTTTSCPQQQIFVNQTNYCSYPFFQTQPLVYSNPFLMTQYLNAFVKETQINTSLVQQQQFLSGGIHERLLYAQMLQQQIQTNQAALMSSYFVGNATGGPVKCKHEMGTSHASEVSSVSLKPDIDGGVRSESPSIEQ